MSNPTTPMIPTAAASDAAPATPPLNPAADARFEMSFLWRCCKLVFRIFTTLVFDLKVWGLEHVPERGGVLLVANHQSFLDPPLVSGRLNRPVSFMAKSELFTNPLFAKLIRSLHAYPVRLGRGDKAAIEETVRRLHEGHVLNIYPEGARTETGKLQPIQRGVALVVKKAGVPIVPVVLDGAYDSYPRGSKFFRPYPIRILYGPPLDVAGLKGEQIVQLIDRTFHEMLADLHRRAKALDPHWSSAMTRQGDA
ncbi:MAG TPA: lysophospholipid acyltransferase family protein [Tepidisphaeraceae bacterium]|nr:lysophospholipid acyltransferase family protein [Tepidisphaeraceae bacterium]